jgi:hypothetical protein
MGRKRKANLEVEYELERQIRDLKQENAKLKKLLRDKEKCDTTEKEIKEPVKVKKVIAKECPSCGANVKITELPMGFLELCESACGYRAVRKK